MPLAFVVLLMHLYLSSLSKETNEDRVLESGLLAMPVETHQKKLGMLI